jgi:putative oxidoreductase
MDIALLLVRLIVGLAIARHGTEKLFGWFGGYGIAGTGGFFEQIGYRPGQLFVLAAAGAEIAGGLLTVLGLGGPVGPALIVMVMLVAIFSVHISKGFSNANGGYELNTLYIAAALAVAFNFGAYSLDRAFGLVTQAPGTVWTTLAVAVVLAALNLLARRPVPAGQLTPNTGG